MVTAIAAIAFASAFGVVAFGVVASAAAAHAPSPIDRRMGQDEPTAIPGAYMVELDDSVTPDQLTETLRSVNVTIRVRRTLSSKLFHGVSVDLDLDLDLAHAGAGQLAAAPGVKQIWPVHAATMPPTDVQSFVSLADANSHSNTSHQRRAATNDTYYPHVMAQVARLHDAGITGQGMRIGIVDTGVDYTNPILGGCLGPGCLFTHGWDAVGWDQLLGPEGIRVPRPDNDPMDCFGHGTHVAGIVGAQPNAFGFLGVAPDARLGAYRVIDCFGYGTEETIAAGMLRAFDDGNHILTLSVSVPRGIPDSFVLQTASRIVAAGVPVFVAIGNTGEYGSLFDPVAPADAPGVVSVGSFDPEREPAVYALAEYAVDASQPVEFAWVPLVNGRYVFGNGTDQKTLPLLDLNRFVVNATAVSACRPIPDAVPDLSGYLVLVERTPQNGCLFRTQRENIKAKNGTHIMFWASEPIIRNIINDDIQTFMATTLPSPATQWRAALAAGSNVSVTLTVPQKARPKVVWTTNNATGGAVSSFTSRGPTMDLRGAPALGGPGRSILSTYLQNAQGVAVNGGTSFAAPFVAASAALLTQALGGPRAIAPAELESLLASTAVLPPRAQPGGVVAAPLQAGAGLVQLWDAWHVQARLDKASLSFNDSDHHEGAVTLTVRNTGAADAVYALHHAAATTTYALGLDGRLATPPLETVAGAAATISFAADRVSVPAGGSALVTVRCAPPQGLDKRRWPIYSGYVRLRGSNGDSLTVPYVGNAGAMREGAVLGAQSVFVSPQLVPEGSLSLPRPGNGSSAPPPDGSSQQPGLVITVFPTLPTRLLRYHVVMPRNNNSTTSNGTGPPVDSDYDNGNGNGNGNATTTLEGWLGWQTYGQIVGSPQALVGKGVSTSITFSGLMSREGNKTLLPPGRYALLISALRLFAEPESKSVRDWQVVQTVPFHLVYT